MVDLIPGPHLYVHALSPWPFNDSQLFCDIEKLRMDNVMGVGAILYDIILCYSHSSLCYNNYASDHMPVLGIVTLVIDEAVVVVVGIWFSIIITVSH